MRYFVVDIFTDKVFGGSPAGVCLLDGYYDLRWFIPEPKITI